MQTTDAAGEARIDAIVGRRRANLTRLTLAARTAAQRCERAEADLASEQAGEVVGAPGDLLGVVDAMLDKAMQATEVALEAARGEAAFTIASARREGAEALRRAGLDPSSLDWAGSTPLVGPSVARPPSARELWRTTRAAVVPPVAAMPVDRPAPPRSPSASLPRDPLSGVAVLERRRAPELDEDVVAIAFALETMPPSVDAVDADRQFDAFWREADGGRRRRARLRRRSPKDDS